VLNKDEHAVLAYYLPGVAPKSFAEGEDVPLKVNKITSPKTLLPLNYYRLPFCQPEGGPHRANENLGEFLAGDRIESSPYILRMKEDMYCEILCFKNVGPEPKNGSTRTKTLRAIHSDYHHNWIVDNLNAASKMEDDSTIATSYWQGFPIGYEEGKESYINNHVNIEIMYHPVETGYRVVRFTIEPFSIHHDFDSDLGDDDEDGSSGNSRKDVTMNNPITSCIKDSEKHTNYDMINSSGHEPQHAHGKVLFTYDVLWIESDLHWASRWDIYLTMDHAVSAKVHWMSIFHSLIAVIFLTSMVALLLVRSLRRDFSRYAKLATDEEKAEEQEEFGWKLVHGDVFRPPTYSPLLLSVACGNGAQILCMTFLTIIFSALGFLNPSNRGSLVLAQLMFYVLMGLVSGYVTARFYKTFKGQHWQKATATTAFLFPGLVFTVFLLLNIMSWIKESTDAVPFTTLVVLIVLWFGVSTPLVFMGAYMGYKVDPIEFPVATSNIPRQIPDQQWYMSLPLTMALAGVLPFGSVYMEMALIMSSVWVNQYYYVFGVFLVVFLILLITCAEVTILFDYFLLCAEDYRWWWGSFFTSGSISIYIFLFSIKYFSDLEANTFATYVLFFGYMTLISISILLMTGFVGVASTLWFNKLIFGSIKVD